MANVNYVFLLSLIIITIGFLIKQIGIVKEENGSVLAKLIFNLTLPALILKTIVSVEIVVSLWMISFIAIIYALILFMIAYILFRNSTVDVKGLMLMSVIGFNVVHLAFPLIDGIWGNDGLKYIVMFDIGNGLIIFIGCYLIGSFFSPKNNSESKKEIIKVSLIRVVKSGPLIAYFIGLPLNLLQIEFPLFFIDLLDIIARANTALTLLLLGIYLNFKFDKTHWGYITKVLLFRYSFGLIFGLFFFFILPFEILYRGIIAIALILPIGLAILPFTVEFEYDKKLAGTSVNLSIIISFVLMWILILILGFG